MKKFFGLFYNLLVLLSVIAGIVSLYSFITDKNDYSLLFVIENESKIIENNTNLADLKVIYKDIQVKSLYGTKIKIINNGKKAITSDFVFQPITINIEKNNTIINVVSSALSNLDKNSFHVDFDLLNPNTSIDMYILTISQPTFNLKYKIKEITEIQQWNKIEDPPLNEKALGTGTISFFILLIFSILVTIDALLLIKGDVVFGQILRLVKDIQTDTNFNKEKTLQKLFTLYEEYNNITPFLLIEKNFLISEVSKKIEQLDTSKERDRYILYKFTIQLVRKGNLYNIRSSYIVIGPIIFIIACIGIILNLAL
jgi:hypothetical protein